MGIIIRQSIKGTIVNYVGAFIGFLTTMCVLTKYLQPEEIGLTRVILEAALFIGALAQLGTSASALRFFPYFKDKKNGNNGFFFYLMLMPTIGALIFIPLYIFLKEPVSGFFSKNAVLFVDYFYWVIPLVIFSIYWSTLETYSVLQMRIVVPKIIREILVRLLLLAVYLLFAFKFLNIDGYVGCFISVYGIAMFLTFLYVSRIGTVSLKHDFSFIDKGLRKKIIQYTLFVLLTVLSAGILGQLDLFMVGSELGLEHAGIYSIAFYMASVIEIPSRSITSISSPIAASSLKENDFVSTNMLYKKVALLQLVTGSCIFLLIWINLDNIFEIIPNGQIYQAGKWVVFFLAISKLISVTLNFGYYMIYFSKYYYWSLYFTIFLTILGVITNLLLIPRLGITGAAIATLITTILALCIQQWIVLIKIKGNPFSIGLLKQMLLLLGVSAVNYLLLPKWSHNPWIDGIYRSTVIGCILVVMIYKMKISDDVCLFMNKHINILYKKTDNFIRKNRTK